MKMDEIPTTETNDSTFEHEEDTNGKKYITYKNLPT